MNDVYYENIGKLIFEFLYLGRSVYYSSKNKCFDDGLTYYLKLFDIDDNKTQKIEIKKEDIEEKLFFNDNDDILNFV